MQATQIMSYITQEQQKTISDMFDKTDKTREFEFIFFSGKGHQLSKEKYVMLLKYMKAMAKVKKLKLLPPEKTLVFGYNVSSIDEKNNEHEVIRTSVSGNNITKVCNRLLDIQNKNYIIYKFLLYELNKQNKMYEFMKKTHSVNDTIEINDLNIKVRSSTETNITKDTMHNSLGELLNGKLNIKQKTLIDEKIFFRLKERTSLLIEDNDDYFIRIDITDTKTTRNLQKIMNNTITSNYELEIEYGIKSNKVFSNKEKQECLKKIYDIAENLLKFIQQSSFIIGNTTTNNIIEYYKEISDITTDIRSIVARQPISLEIQHLTEILPNRYAVTDKADGDRFLMIIYKLGVYLINTNLIVRDTGIILDKSFEHYNGSLFDGEYIYIQSERRHIYLIFDCMRNGLTDIRPTSSLMQRIQIADNIIKDCFIFKGQTGMKYTQMPTQATFDIDNAWKHYDKELTKYYDVLNTDMKFVKEYPLIRRKYFVPVFGAARWEISKYSVLLWEKYTIDAKTKFPYHLDGLIYQPLEQAYITNVADSKYPDYKWKPPVKNSIDFYIEFTKDPYTGQIYDVFDNSNIKNDEEEVISKNKTYRICTLYAGNMREGKEIPEPFVLNNGTSDAYLFHNNGEVRDMNGDVITDKTVVEFYYINDATIPPQQRWVPLKTRYDKTESVERYGRKYGNYMTIAEKVWRSITNPILMDDFIELAKGNTTTRAHYDIKVKELNSKISQQLIISANRENKYFQKVSNLAKAMRFFHNFVKSNLIYTYCNKLYQSNTQQSVLDIAFGRGADISKYYYTNVAFLVAIDIDADAFKSPVDGAISRYNKLKKSKPDFPKMYFIQANAGALFTYDAQLNALSGMDETNKRMLRQFFPDDGHISLFDRISCQFAMHYFLKDKISWDNFKANLKKHLRNGGYFFATAFDAQEVLKVMKDKDTYTEYYDENGQKKKFFEIVKQYDNSNKQLGVGQGIDVYMSWLFDEGTYRTEYLVDFEFIKSEFDKDVDLELIDSDLFANQLTIHEKFLTDAARYESVYATNSTLSKFAEYYDNTDMNIKCKGYTNLNRYFVFRKRMHNTKQVGGNNYDFSDITKYKIPSMSNYDNEYSFLSSIHKILVSHSLFPKSVGLEEFANDMETKLLVDNDIDKKYIKKLSKKIIINHEIDDKIKNILNGINIFIVERDCNNFYDIEQSSIDKKNSIVIMREGGLYRPIMKIDDIGVRGLFKNSDDVIQYLIENGSIL